MSGVADADNRGRRVVVVDPGVLVDLVEDGHVRPGRKSESAVAFGKVHPRQVVGELCAPKRDAVHFFGMNFVEEQIQ